MTHSSTTTAFHNLKHQSSGSQPLVRGLLVLPDHSRAPSKIWELLNFICSCSWNPKMFGITALGQFKSSYIWDWSHLQLTSFWVWALVKLLVEDTTSKGHTCHRLFFFSSFFKEKKTFLSKELYLQVIKLKISISNNCKAAVQHWCLNIHIKQYLPSFYLN